MGIYRAVTAREAVVNASASKYGLPASPLLTKKAAAG